MAKVNPWNSNAGNCRRVEQHPPLGGKREFDPQKEYGNWFIKTYYCDSMEKNFEKILAEQRAEVLAIIKENAELSVPKEFHSQIEYGERQCKGFYVTITEDNYEEYGADRVEIGTVIGSGPYAIVFWLYTPKKELVNA